MRLVHEFTYRTAVTGPQVVGSGPYGVRHCYMLEESRIDGSRLTAEAIGTGADWMLVGAAGFLRMDVRLQFRTTEGIILLVRYHGSAEANECLRTALAAGRPTSFEDQSIRTSWTIESGDPHYDWVNQAIFIGEGRACPTSDGRPGFEHRVFRAA